MLTYMSSSCLDMFLLTCRRLYQLVTIFFTYSGLTRQCDSTSDRLWVHTHSFINCLQCPTYRIRLVHKFVTTQASHMHWVTIELETLAKSQISASEVLADCKAEQVMLSPRKRRVPWHDLTSTPTDGACTTHGTWVKQFTVSPLWKLPRTIAQYHKCVDSGEILGPKSGFQKVTSCWILGVVFGGWLWTALEACFLALWHLRFDTPNIKAEFNTLNYMFVRIHGFIRMYFLYCFINELLSVTCPGWIVTYILSSAELRLCTKILQKAQNYRWVTTKNDSRPPGEPLCHSGRPPWWDSSSSPSTACFVLWDASCPCLTTLRH